MGSLRDLFLEIKLLFKSVREDSSKLRNDLGLVRASLILFVMMVLGPILATVLGIICFPIHLALLIIPQKQPIIEEID